MNLTALLALVRKDLLLYLRDRRALLLNLAMPIMLGAFFGYLFGGSGAPNSAPIGVAVVNLDNSATGRQVAAGLQADAALKTVALSADEARQAVLKGRLDVAVVIPAGFGEAAGAALFGAGPKPQLEIYHDPSRMATLAVVKGVLSQHVMQQVSADMMGGTGGQAVVARSIAQLAGPAASDPEAARLRDFLGSLQRYQQASASAPARPAAAQAASAASQAASTPPAATGASGPASAGTARPAGGLSMPYTTREEALSAGPRYNAYAHAFAGMAVQFILFLGVDVGIGLLLQRRQGLWQRLLAAPVPLHTVLLARLLSCAVIAFGLVMAIYLVAGLVFQVHVLGSVPGFLGVAASFALMTASFGLLIAAFGKTPEAARGIAVFATLLMVMLGGAWVPSFLFPAWLQQLTLAVPTRWAVDGLDGMTWRGLGGAEALPVVAVLLGFALVFGALAFWRLGRDEGAPSA